jgi:hypothetical protein
MKNLVYIIALVFALTTSAFAQSSFNESTNDGAFAPIQIAAKLGGVETTKGTYDVIDNKFWSNTFALNGSDGSHTSHFTISMDYMNAKPGRDAEVVSGNWTLSVFKGGEYQGLLFGDVVGGYITWNYDNEENPLSRFTSVKVRILGGTGVFEGSIDQGATGIFNSYSEVGTKMPAVKASLEIGF